MNEKALLKSLLDKYEISEPMPLQARRTMNRSKKKNLAAIIKKHADVFFLTGAAVSLFFSVKKIGISISITKSAVLLTIASVAAAGIVALTAVYAVKHLIPEQQVSPGETFAQQKVSDPVQSGDGIAAGEVMSYAIAVDRVSMAGVTAARRSVYTGTIISELRREKGELAAINSYSLDKFHVSKKVLSVSIIELKNPGAAGSVFRISAKVVSSENSRVLMYISETAQGEDAINNSLKVLMEKVSSLL